MKFNKEEIIKLEYKLIEAIKKSDIDFFEKILHDDLYFLAPNGILITKQMDLDSHKSKQMIVEELTPSFENLTIIDEIAISIMTYETKGMMLGNPIQGKFRYIRNWKVFPDSIKIISGACLKIE